ncbi:MAG: hypothetical protein BroJett030_30480 [Alphaproteobacteria bacterium]|nr:MAG: hypothetical protein BroJett030_30480 [Alphaproteobacteria bacterium]
MDAHQLEAYLHEHIPLSRAMQVAVARVAADAVELRAPLAPNINHRETLFGGSASAIAILAAWSLVHVRLRAEGIASRIVIQRHSMHFDEPVAGDFIARSQLEADADWQRFLATLGHMGRAAIAVAATIEHHGRRAARFSGRFAALGSEE